MRRLRNRCDAAGELFEHPAGYALSRYLPGKRPAAANAAILTQAGTLLLRRSRTSCSPTPG